MEESQAIKNGRIYVEERRTILLTMSIGNSYFYKVETLEKLMNFSKTNSDQIVLFLPEQISQHNFKAVGSKNPAKSARKRANNLRNKCREAMQSCGLQDESFRHVSWVDHVESSSAYIQTLSYIKCLYQENEEFRTDVLKTTASALASFKKAQEKDLAENKSSIDLEEGVEYPLKELAFFCVVPDIYENCEKYVFVYHHPWHWVEKFFDGGYDGIRRPFFGYFILE